MKNNIITKLFLVLLVLGFVNQSCTDLDTELYSDITPDDFFQNDDQFIAALGAAYTAFYGFMGDFYAAQEVPSDEVVVPTRGADWDDGGHWRRLHTHGYNPNDPIIGGAWGFAFGGVSTCNRLIAQIGELAEPSVAEPFIAELRGVRAMFYWFLLDVYGNVPIQTEFFGADPNPPTQSRESVYNFVISELEDIVSVLPDGVNQSTYARMNQWVVKAMLVKLYLNAEIYAGKTEYAKAATAAKDIIDSGNYSLEGDYFKNFATVNESSREFIFAIPYDGVNAQGFNLHQRTLHYRSQATYNFQDQPWNGYCSLEEFYNSFDDDDARKRSFLVGPQFALDGTRLSDDGAEANDPDGPPLTFTPEINELTPFALRQAGARIGKWEFGIGSTPNLDNDYAVLRYGDILLARAEALLRDGGDASEATMLVNMVRERAGLEMLPGTATLDDVYEEIRKETCFEAYARPTMIRFGKYNDAWWEKPADASDHVNIMPIPESQLNANPNLTQNPGY